MIEHDYVFIGFTLLMALLLSLSRLKIGERSYSNAAPSSKITNEFTGSFLKAFKPLMVLSAVLATAAMFRNVQVGMNTFIGLLMASLVIAFSFSFYKLFRGRAKIYVLPLVVIYTVFSMSYIFKLFMRTNAL